MEKQTVNNEQGKKRGVRLSRVNVLLIFLGLVIALFMVFSMYETNRSFNQIVNMTESYLSSQQTAGMLSNIANGMSEQCAAFLRTGEPDCVHVYAGQLSAINAQFKANETMQSSDERRN